MKLYHGSPYNLSVIKRCQAQTNGHSEVDKKELLNAIYVSPIYEHALAIAAMPDGGADVDEPSKTIQFEHPEKFDPEKVIYVYEVDSENIPEGKLLAIDDRQLVITDTEGIIPSAKYTHKARDIAKYYELKKEPLETKRDTDFMTELKIK